MEGDPQSEFRAQGEGEALPCSPDEIVEGPASGVARGAVGLARLGDPIRWVFVERVPLAEVAAWEQDKQSGAGGDRRLGAPRGHLMGTSVLLLQEALSGFPPKDLREVPD